MKDPISGDNQFITAVLSEKYQVMVNGDNNVLRMSGYADIEIVKPNPSLKNI